ncbi:hypothetical protein [Rhizobacter sp. Root1221]|uniref:hypothetical protein n=1 Tax=Rhizobacter sp. Root1221 TaxID=1736433 RepID=UPI000AD45E6F|nr:hypothetical protein [Rhizobacter sp. Root1221]
MPDIHVPTLFALLGPAFLLLGAGRCLAARAWHPQGRTWLIVGTVFSAVAVWLHLHPA